MPGQQFIDPIDLDEETEIFDVRLVRRSGGGVVIDVATRNVEVTIYDDDGLHLTVTADPDPAVTGTGAGRGAVVTTSLLDADGNLVVPDVSTTLALTAFPRVIAAPTNNGDGTWTGTVTNTDAEVVEVTATLTSTDPEQDGLTRSFRVRFVEPAPAASITGPASGSVDEDATTGGTAEYTVTLSGSPSEEVTVTWAVTNGGSESTATDTAAADFTGGSATPPVLSGSVSFDAGATGNGLTKTFTVPIADDDADELDTETFTVTLTTAADPGVLTIDGTAGCQFVPQTQGRIVEVTSRQPHFHVGFGHSTLRSYPHDRVLCDLPRSGCLVTHTS